MKVFRGLAVGAAIFTLVGTHTAGGRAIIGIDDRCDVHEAGAQAFRRASRATAALVRDDGKTLEKRRAHYRFVAGYPSYGVSDRMCADVRFVEQPAPAYCTGFLVADDRLVTAAHCVRDHAPKDFLFVFDFATDNSGSVRQTFGRSQVFRSRTILAKNADEDWAVLQLDRRTGREPLAIHAGPGPALGTRVAIVGHPHGLPTKVAPGGKVVATHFDPPSDVFFEATLDAFAGNSGSPVLDERSGAVLGIYVVGFGEYEDDVDPTSGKACRRPRHWPDPDDGMPGWAVRAARFRAAAVSDVSRAREGTRGAAPGRPK